MTAELVAAADVFPPATARALLAEAERAAAEILSRRPAGITRRPHDMTPSEGFVRLAQAVFGEQWQSEASRRFAVNGRTLRRIATGEISPPDGLVHELVELAGRRRVEIWEAELAIEESRRVDSLPKRRIGAT